MKKRKNLTELKENSEDFSACRCRLQHVSRTLYTKTLCWRHFSFHLQDLVPSYAFKPRIYPAKILLFKVSSFRPNCQVLFYEASRAIIRIRLKWILNESKQICNSNHRVSRTIIILLWKDRDGRNVLSPAQKTFGQVFLIRIV